MLTLEGIGRGVAGRTLFEGVHWTIHPGDRFGFVGPNGSGKTTLLRIVAGRDEPDAGRLRARRGLRVAYLPQEVEAELPGDAAILEAVLTVADDVRALGAEVDALAARMAELAGQEDGDGELAEVAHLYGEKRALFEWFGGDALEARARIVLSGLGFSNAEMDRAVRTFSGGWRMRAVMARLLLSGADLLLLDEPTNHLDLQALAWLEAHLVRSPAALIVVSHDRVFLDRVVTKVADLYGGKLRVTPGGYSAFLAAREERNELARRRDRKLAQDETRLERFVERFRYKATKARQAQERERMLDGVREQRAAIEVETVKDWGFRWPEPPPASDPVLRLERVTKRYDGKTVLDGVDVVLRRGERIALLGANGAGKTTLLRLISGDLYPDAGVRHAMPGLLVGHFAQHQLEAMKPERSVIDECGTAAPARTPEELRAALGRFGLGELHIDRPVRTLSGGERARLALAKLLLRPSSLLLLDEPTNHLDLPLREALEESLSEWAGTLVVVSHDRAFLDRLTTDSILVDDGRAERIQGGWQGWLARLEERAPRTAGRSCADSEGDLHERSRAGRRARAEAMQERNRRLKPLREAVSRYEADIAAAEARRDEVDALLALPKTHTDGALARALVQERAEIAARLDDLFERWSDASSELEALEAAQ